MPGTVEHLTNPQDPALQILLRYWRGKRGERMAPSRADIQPGELVSMLPYLALYDVVDGDFHVRLFGTELARAYGDDLTGKLMSECDFDGSRRQLLEQLAEVVRERRPNVLRAKFAKDTDGRYLEYERIALPLSANGETVNMILCGYHVERAF
ncbi:MAG TPA: PAS domain-containing protein [Bradyrhizobium sp.]|uniref:PAS domain-containing protein n=1 Tax=Bradyrhizobium sp. TaxID=376 RepID=UPI002BA76CB0|nr:PAS domain-containing protein [Bradyrhizobium sp.]HLZ03980.1 PAS domain-containing protein [Bradyrhizobium sp.]